ncbi:MAG: type II toxin-antitoxin system RelE/ParE family toxin [Phycisphaerae bacterium]|nr:type II toxin-antitoxin system RelE/ParE family toxin [Phycisphaerae bacterium]
MNCSFHPEAETEFLEAIDYYESCRIGLGCEFSLEVYSAIELIRAHPKTWPVLDGEIRRFLVSRFPHGILYADDQGSIRILAIMHLHRDPDYWKHRVRS